MYTYVYIYSLSVFFSQFLSKEKRFRQKSGRTTVENVIIRLYSVLVYLYNGVFRSRKMVYLHPLYITIMRKDTRSILALWFYVTLLENDGGNETHAFGGEKK